MNTVNLVGRLTRDPEIRSTANDVKVARFSLAINRIGEGADFPNCVAFNKTAEILGSYTRKGSRIGVVGHLQTGSYEKDGAKVYTTDVIVDRVDLLDSRQDNEPPKNPEPVFKEVTADADVPF